MQIRINKPCSENWDNMKIGDDSRFCGSCQKNVIDFTTKSHEEILDYFHQSRGTKVCGRFHRFQLDQPLPDLVITPRPPAQKGREVNLYLHLLAVGAMVLAGCQDPATQKNTNSLADTHAVQVDTLTKSPFEEVPVEKPYTAPERSVTNKTEPTLDAFIPEEYTTIIGDTVISIPDDIEKNEVEEEANIIMGMIAEEPPGFPGGEENLYRFLYQNVEYPKWEKENGVEGRVVVRFVVDKTGKPKNFTIVRSVTPNFDAEVLRVVKLMPDWTPGKQNRKPTDVWFSLPVNFELPPKEGN